MVKENFFCTFAAFFIIALIASTMVRLPAVLVASCYYFFALSPSVVHAHLRASIMPGSDEDGDDVCQHFRIESACADTIQSWLTGREFIRVDAGDPPCGGHSKEGYPVYRTVVSPYGNENHDWLQAHEFFSHWYFVKEQKSCNMDVFGHESAQLPVTPMDPTKYDGSVTCWGAPSGGMREGTYTPFEVACLDSSVQSELLRND